MMTRFTEFLMKVASYGISDRRRFLRRFAAFVLGVSAVPFVGRVARAQSDPCVDASYQACVDPGGTGCTGPLAECSGEICVEGQPSSLRFCHFCYYDECHCVPSCGYYLTYLVAVFASPYCCYCIVEYGQWSGAPCDYECANNCA